MLWVYVNHQFTHALEWGLMVDIHGWCMSTTPRRLADTRQTDIQLTQVSDLADVHLTDGCMLNEDRHRRLSSM